MDNQNLFQLTQLVGLRWIEMKTIQIQRGITLIEMMIAMLLGLIVTGTIITIFISNVKSSSENIQMIHLNQELRTVMGFVSDELKRAGYSGTAEPDHMDFLTPTAGCVLYAYDLDEDGDVDDDEKFGFRLNGNVIEWGENVACGADANWTGLTESSIADIQTFNIQPTTVPTASSTIFVERLDITIIGVKALNPGTASRTISESIRVRNEDAS